MDNKPYVLITGASSGIGKTIAINLSHDYNVILHGRNEERLNEVKMSCSEGSHIIWNFDLADVDNLEDSLKAVLAGYSVSVSYFVHCAGFMKMLPLKMVNKANLNATFTTNIFSAILISKVLTSKKINGNSLKSIVFISSNISNRGAKAFSTYAASKGALDSLMRCLAVELAPNVRVNSILPGAVQTDMTENIFENKEVLERMTLAYPLGIGFPNDIYEVVNFLISERARWITGQQITVDGGRDINITG